MKIADLFCGAGGESTGILQACHAAGQDCELLAVNHWDVAIETHSRNHPDARHMCESIQSIDPVQAVPGRRLNLLWASPECTHHSNARGGRPRSNQSRASAWLVLKWLQELYVDHVIIENVPEFVNWGPLDARGKALPKRKGETFHAFVHAVRSLGYRVDWRILNAADYGAPTTRRRFFLQARRKRGAIRWPEATYAAKPQLDGLFPDTRQPWIPARDIIDWSMPGKSIFERKKPLAAATLNRIEAGIKRYWGELAEPFLVVLRGTGKTRDISRPLPTITAGGGHLGLIEPFLTRYNGGRDRNSGVDSPVPTLDCSNRYAVIEPLIIDQTRTNGPHAGRIIPVSRPVGTVTTKNKYALCEPLILHQMSGGMTRPVSMPLPTITTRSAHQLIEPFVIQYYGNGDARPISAPLDTVTCRDRFALINGCPVTLDIRFRMLQPHELSAAQGFPADYWFAGNKGEQVKQIGNAVPCPLARALAESAMVA